YAYEYATKISSLRWMMSRHPEIKGCPPGAARVYGQLACWSAATGNRSAAWRYARAAVKNNWREPRAAIALAAVTRMVRVESVVALALVDGGWLEPSSEFASWEECEQALRPPEIDGLPANELRGYLRRGHPTWSPEAVEATLYNMRIWPDGTITRRLSIDRHM